MCSFEVAPKPATGNTPPVSIPTRKEGGRESSYAVSSSAIPYDFILVSRSGIPRQSHLVIGRNGALYNVETYHQVDKSDVESPQPPEQNNIQPPEQQFLSADTEALARPITESAVPIADGSKSAGVTLSANSGVDSATPQALSNPGAPMDGGATMQVTPGPRASADTDVVLQQSDMFQTESDEEREHTQGESPPRRNHRGGSLSATAEGSTAVASSTPSSSSSKPGSTISHTSSIDDDVVVCSVKGAMGIKEFKHIFNGKYLQKLLGLMVIHNGNHDIEMKIIVISCHRNAPERGMMIIVKPLLPRKCCHNVVLLDTRYELHVIIHEEKTKTRDVLSKYITKPFTLRSKNIECELFSESQLQVSSCSRLHITAEVVSQKPNVELHEPTESSDFVNISVKRKPTATDSGAQQP